MTITASPAPCSSFSMMLRGKRLFSNIAAAMQGVPAFIIERQLGHFDKIHPDYGNGVRAALEAFV